VVLAKGLGTMSNSSRNFIRKHLFVDPPVQIALVLRVTCYWIICCLAIALLLVCWRVVTEPTASTHTILNYLWFYVRRACELSLVLLPLVIFDILRLSNRFVGPLLRLRRSMRQLARGEPVAPLEFRDNDFWQEFAAEFNAVAAIVQKQKPPTQPGAEKAAPEAKDRKPETPVGAAR
jgi:hypothetical protein